MTTYPPDLEQYVDSKIASGQFRSRDEFAQEAARVFRDVEARHAELRTDIQAAINESNAGLSDDLDIDAIKRELRAEFDENARGK